MRVKLPAEAEDWQRRPAYIRENNAGVNICENRSVEVALLSQKRKFLDEYA